MNRSVVVIGGGMAGLNAALVLAAHGVRVTLVERAAQVGGKVRVAEVAGHRIDVGPTVLTMRWVLDRLFASVGRSTDDVLGLVPLEILARHAWPDGTRLDLFVDAERSAAAIDAFAGPHEADGFRRFCAYARGIYETCEEPFILAEQPGLRALLGRVGLRGLMGLRRIDGMRTMWRSLGDFFVDPRLRQLFARYATYYGSDPFQAPATLNLIADVEMQGVWVVDGGMVALAECLARLAGELGVEVRTGVDVREIIVHEGRAVGVATDEGERIEGDAVICNADVNAVATGRFGPAVQGAVRGVAPEDRSLSALTVATVAAARGFPLVRHNVFFSGDYRAEFEAIGAGGLPGEPTVYVCAQDRDAVDVPGGAAEERLFLIINAPSIGDRGPRPAEEIDACLDAATALMRRCGLTISLEPDRRVVTEPVDFERAFPATGGALYGAATHRWHSALTRPGAVTQQPGLYVASGSAHPGAGVPMASLGGQIAATRVLEDLGVPSRLPRGATPGGASTG